jgi:hypothetical protein
MSQNAQRQTTNAWDTMMAQSAPADPVVFNAEFVFEGAFGAFASASVRNSTTSGV